MVARLLTLGQYLQPSKDHLPVARFVSPEEFEQPGRNCQGDGIFQCCQRPYGALILSCRSAGESSTAGTVIAETQDLAPAGMGSQPVVSDANHTVPSDSRDNPVE